MRWVVGMLCVACAAEGGGAADDGSTTSTTGINATGAATIASTSAPGTSGSTSIASSSTSTTGAPAASSGSGSTTTSSTVSTGSDLGCPKNVVLMGYWPPTNEMLRPWSTDAEQNPDGWVGENWGGSGFDVYAFFPEFPPDGDPSNDPIGSEGSVGSPESDLRVDYQDTSEDFWRIVDEFQPHILITTSRGGNTGWEIEAIEGGHGGAGPDPAFDWSSDGYPPETQPTETTVDARTWTAISTFRDGTVLDSQLPMDLIEQAASALALVSVDIDENGTSGNYLSGFLGLHGVYYGEQTPHNVAAGHIHVGFAVPTVDASTLIEATLQTVIDAHPVATLDCPRL